MSEHLFTGFKGELKAIEFLEQLGYKILETNWSFRNCEVDIIAQDKNELVIVEVKTRKNNLFGEPEEWVKKDKQKNLIKAANYYIEKKHLDTEVRFDIISVLYNQSGFKINHIISAFSPFWRFNN